MSIYTNTCIYIYILMYNVCNNKCIIYAIYVKYAIM